MEENESSEIVLNIRVVCVNIYGIFFIRRRETNRKGSRVIPDGNLLMVSFGVVVTKVPVEIWGINISL